MNDRLAVGVALGIFFVGVAFLVVGIGTLPGGFIDYRVVPKFLTSVVEQSYRYKVEYDLAPGATDYLAGDRETYYTDDLLIWMIEYPEYKFLVLKPNTVVRVMPTRDPSGSWRLSVIPAYQLSNTIKYFQMAGAERPFFLRITDLKTKKVIAESRTVLGRTYIATNDLEKDPAFHGILPSPCSLWLYLRVPPREWYEYNCPTF